MASIKEVALRCGVSVATVSKALNNKSDVGEETKQKILTEKILCKNFFIFVLF